MKAKVTHEWLEDRLEKVVSDEEYGDVFCQGMGRENEFSDVRQVYTDWFVFEDDKFKFMYHRSWLEFAESE